MNRARVPSFVSLAALVVLGLLGTLGTSGCNQEALSEDTVTSIPPGSGRGTALSGTRQVTWVTTDCDGDCFPVRLTETILYGVCDRGFRQTTTATFSQQDGALVMDVEGSSFVSQLRGGVNGDGSFDVGGVKTEVSGTFTMRGRVDGRLDPNGGGRARARVITTPRTRDAGVLSTNCTSTHELTFAPLEPVAGGTGDTGGTGGGPPSDAGALAPGPDGG